jgi:hypothetical protein
MRVVRWNELAPAARCDWGWGGKHPLSYRAGMSFSLLDTSEKRKMSNVSCRHTPSLAGDVLLVDAALKNLANVWYCFFITECICF